MIFAFSFESLYPLFAIILAVVVITILLVLFKAAYDKFTASAEAKEIKAELQNRIAKIRGETTEETDEKVDNVLTQMNANVTEMKEYYVISKRQARQTFSAAMIACFLGFALFAMGILISYSGQSDSSIAYSTVGGSMVEVIAGLFFWMYSKALTQLNFYHESLTETQNDLASMQLVKKMSKENRDKAYAYIITKLMDQNQAATLDVSSDSTSSNASSNTATSTSDGSVAVG